MNPEPESEPSLAMIVRRLHLLRGLSVRQLAHAAGLPPTTLQAIEEGRAHRPRIETVVALARALGTDTIGLLALAGYCASPGPGAALHDALWEGAARRGRPWPDKNAWISTLIGQFLAASRRTSPDTAWFEAVPGLTVTDAEWAAVERGVVPKRLAQEMHLPGEAGLCGLSSHWLWGLASSALLSPTPTFFVAGRVSPAVASAAGVDWLALVAAWDAARQSHPPYLDVRLFLELWRSPAPDQERPTLTPRSHGGWIITIPPQYDGEAALHSYEQLLKAQSRK